MKNTMKKMIAPIALGIALLVAGPAYAHDVKKGDTMYRIAVNNDMSLIELASLNPTIKNLNLIYVGQNINTNKNNVQEAEIVAKTVQLSKVARTHVSNSERDLMARLVRAEATGEPYAGKVAVAVVVLNRMDSSEFPNTVESVIYQKGQFSPVANGSINKVADPESVRAVNEALTLDRSKGDNSLFFYNSNLANSRWLDSRPTTMIIGNHTFKK